MPRTEGRKDHVLRRVEGLAGTSPRNGLGAPLRPAWEYVEMTARLHLRATQSGARGQSIASTRDLPLSTTYTTTHRLRREAYIISRHSHHASRVWWPGHRRIRAVAARCRRDCNGQDALRCNRGRLHVRRREGVPSCVLVLNCSLRNELRVSAGIDWVTGILPRPAAVPHASRRRVHRIDDPVRRSIIDA